MKPWLMALIAGKPRVLKTAGPFTANAVWIAPVTTSKIENATGKGSAGTPDTWESDTHSVMTCLRTTGNQTGGVITSKLDAVIDGSNASGAFSVGGTATRTITHQQIIYSVGPNNLARRGSPINITRTVRGQEITTVGSTTGDITHTPNSTTYVRVTVDTKQSGTPGTATTAFGKSFPGGATGAAPITSYSAIDVIPGASYPLTVPAGGSLTFTYYE